MRATLIGAVAILLWSSQAVLTAASGSVPPFQLTAITFAIGAAVGFASWLVRGTPPSVLVQPPKVWLLGVGGLFGYHALYFVALSLAPPAEASLLNYLWPLLIVLLSALLPGETLTGRHIAGGLLGLAGTVILIAGQPQVEPGRRTIVGWVIAVAAALVWATYSVATAALSRGGVRQSRAGERKPSPNRSHARCCGDEVGRISRRYSENAPRRTASMPSSHFLPCRRNLQPTSPPRDATVRPIRASDVPSDVVAGFCLATAALAAVVHLLVEPTVWPASPSQWSWIVAIGLGPVGIAFYVWDHGMKHGDIRLLATLSYAAPILSTIWLMLAGYTRPTPAIFVSCALIIVAAIIARSGTTKGRHGVDSR